MITGLYTAGPTVVFSGMNIRRSVAVATLGVAAGAAIVGATLSPFALALAGEAIPLDWKLLADIGQTYGATSAIISALALQRLKG
jgi:FtsH-binding integral membrane protein